MTREYKVIDYRKEPEFDEFWDYVVPTSGRGRDLVVRAGVIYERDPDAAARLVARQNAAILDLLVWGREHRGSAVGNDDGPP